MTEDVKRLRKNEKRRLTPEQKEENKFWRRERRRRDAELYPEKNLEKARKRMNHPNMIEKRKKREEMEEIVALQKQLKTMDLEDKRKGKKNVKRRQDKEIKDLKKEFKKQDQLKSDIEDYRHQYGRRERMIQEMEAFSVFMEKAYGEIIPDFDFTQKRTVEKLLKDMTKKFESYLYTEENEARCQWDHAYREKWEKMKGEFEGYEYDYNFRLKPTLQQAEKMMEKIRNKYPHLNLEDEPLTRSFTPSVNWEKKYFRKKGNNAVICLLSAEHRKELTATISTLNEEQLISALNEKFDSNENVYFNPRTVSEDELYRNERLKNFYIRYDLEHLHQDRESGHYKEKRHEAYVEDFEEKDRRDQIIRWAAFEKATLEKYGRLPNNFDKEINFFNTPSCIQEDSHNYRPDLLYLLDSPTPEFKLKTLDDLSDEDDIYSHRN